MKLLLLKYSVSLAAVLSFYQEVACFTIFGSYDDIACTKMAFVSIVPGECNSSSTSGCKSFDGLGRSKFCIDDVAKYANSAFGGSAYFLVEGFNDENCTQSSSSYAVVADKTCHNVWSEDRWALQTVVSEDGAVGLYSGTSCNESDSLRYSVGPVSKAIIDTGYCMAVKDGFEKYHFVTPGSTDPANTTSTTSGKSSSPRTVEYFRNAPLSLVCSALMVFSLVAL